MHVKFTGLWRHPDFLKLWTGETISLFGSQITALALPLTAALVLKSTPAEMGFLATVEFLPFLLLSLFAGVWVDRLRRKPILVIADIGRGILLGTVPAAFFLGILSIELLYVVGFLTGIMTVFFDVAYQSYLPALVERDHLVEGNGKLEISRSTAQISGPGLAGALVQVVSAPVAILIDAVSYFFSAFFIGQIKKPEVKEIHSAAQKKSIWHEIGEGLGIVFGNPVLRSIAACTATSNLFSNILMVVFTLYMVNELRLEPAIIGLIFAISSIGSLIGAFGASWAAQRFGLGWAIIGSTALSFVNLLIPLTGATSLTTIPFLIAAMFSTALGGTVYNINQVSLRQAITPDRLQGRMNASMRFVVWGTIPVGSLIGGFLGETFGLRPTLLIGAIGGSLAFLWVLFSPVRRLKEQPRPVEEIAVDEPETLTLTPQGH
jgi:MFS family permease